MIWDNDMIFKKPITIAAFYLHAIMAHVGVLWIVYKTELVV